jgi:hypothetical protein
LLPPPITIMRWRRHWQITSLIWQLKTEPIENHLIQHEEHSSINSNEKNLGIWSLAVTVSLLSLLWSFFFGEGKKETIPQKRKKKLLSSAITLKVRGFFYIQKECPNHVPQPWNNKLFLFCFISFFVNSNKSFVCLGWKWKSE